MYIEESPEVLTYGGAIWRRREHILFNGRLIDHIDKLGAGDCSIPVSNRIQRFYRSRTRNIEPIVLAIATVPSIAATADLKKVVES